MSINSQIVCSYDASSSVLATGFSADSVQWFKESKKVKSGTCRPFLSTSKPVDEVKVFVKKYTSATFKGLFRRYIDKKTHYIWDIHCALYSAGVNVPKPFALIREKNSKGLCEYILSECLDDTHDMRSLVSQNVISNRGNRQNFLQSTAQLLASMHNLGITHGDFKFANIMLATKNKAVFSVDFDGAKNTKSLRLFAKDIARFSVGMAEAGFSTEDQSTFLSEYTALSAIDRDQLSLLAEKHTQKITARHKTKYPDRYSS